MYYGSDTQGCVSQIPLHSQLGEVAGGQTAESKNLCMYVICVLVIYVIYTSVTIYQNKVC